MIGVPPPREIVLTQAETRPMLQTFRLILATSSLAVVALPAGFVLTDPAFAQAAAGSQDEAPKQVVLTQALIGNLMAAQPDMSVVQEQAQTDKPDAKAEAKLEAIAKKHGFDSLAAYEEAADTVGLVLAGMDPETKTYVGPVAIIKKQIAQVEADKTLPAKDKAETLKEMKEALTTADDSKPMAGNIDLVAKNYDKLSEGFQAGGGGGSE